MFPFYFGNPYLNQMPSYYPGVGSIPNFQFSYWGPSLDQLSITKKPQNQEITPAISPKPTIQAQSGLESKNIAKEEKKIQINKEPYMSSDPKLVQKRKKHSKKDSSYLPKQYNYNPEEVKSRYCHKNFESNIINKIFSFLWSQDKSRMFVEEYLGDFRKIAIFYDFIKTIRKYCKRYITKQYLINLCYFSPQHIAYKIVTKKQQKLKYFSLKQFSKTVAYLIRIYLNKICTISILTSKKLKSELWREHLQKSRNIKLFLFEKLDEDEYQRRLSLSYLEIYADSEKKQLEEQIAQMQEAEDNEDAEEIM